MNTAYLFATGIGSEIQGFVRTETPKTCIEYSTTTESHTSFPDCEQWVRFDDSTGVIAVRNPVADLVKHSGRFISAAAALPHNSEIENEADEYFMANIANRFGVSKKL